MYRVIKFFRDLQDNNHAYHVGDIFPHGGMAVSEDRLLELSTDTNRRRIPLIEKVEEDISEKETTTQEPDEGFMNPPVESDDVPEEPKPTKKRGRPRNDAK